MIVENIIYKTDYCTFVPTEMFLESKHVWRFAAGKAGDRLWRQKISKDIKGELYTEKEILMFNGVEKIVTKKKKYIIQRKYPKKSK